MKKVIFGIGLILLLVGYFGFKMYAASVAEERINLAIAEASEFVDIDYDDVSVDAMGLDVRISNVTIAQGDDPEKIKIEEVVVHDIDGSSEMPLFMSICLKGMKLENALKPTEIAQLKEYGYDEELLTDISIDYLYDEDAKELTVKKFSGNTDNLGKMDLSLHISNINLNPEMTLEQFLQNEKAMIHGAIINYTDDSFFNRIIEVEAKKAHKSPTELKQILMQELEKSTKGQEDQFTQDVISAVKKFVENPKKFSISINPDKPVIFNRLMRTKNPQALIDLLNLEVKS